MRTRVIAVLAFLIMTAGTALATGGTMGVTVNGKAVVFTTAPRFENNVLLVPLVDVLKELNIEAAWNVKTNTLEVKDSRDARINELEAQVKTLEAKTGGVSTASSPAPSTGPVPVPADKTAKGLQSFLQEKYPKVQTAAGDFHLTYKVWGPTDSKSAPDDYWIEMFWSPAYFFPDLDSRRSITKEMKESAVATVRSHARLVYDIMSATFPGKKLEGSYKREWYDYPSIKYGLNWENAMSWANYNDDAKDYAGAHVTEFHWVPRWDNLKL